MFPRASLVALALAAVASAQQVGTNTPESHPKITATQCSAVGSCTTSQHSLVLDANWRWLHTTSGYTNCYTGNKWDTSLCPDATTCAKNCALDGADYSGTYGISTSGNAATLGFVTQNANGQNVGSRTYLMDASDKGYQGFNLVGQEFTLTVDMSKLGCGLNGAVYFSEMALDGGVSTQPNNVAGAKYGTGYCDSQCPRDLKFIGGTANVAGWTSTTTNSGKGNYGSCCSEMDIWEANQFAEAVTPHPCSSTGLQRADCSSNAAQCASGGICDAAGCDFNSWRMGNQTFLGPGSGFTIDTTKPVQVVTQFISSDGTQNGDLIEIRRKFVQNGKVFDNSYSNIPGLTPYNSITDATCKAQKTAFSDTNDFATLGGLKVMGQAFKRGMVLVLSIWDDTSVSMLWLDSDYPTTASPSSPGVNRGPCATTSGKPADIESSQASAKVVYSDIRWGAIGSTYSGTAVGSSPPGSSSVSSGSTTRPSSSSSSTSTSTSASSSPSSCSVSHYGQCGGQGYTGCTTCASGSTCKSSNQYYSQCL